MWDSQFPVNYHHWPGNWSCSLFGWAPLMSAKPTVKAKESYLCGGTKPTKQWWKNTKDGGWVLMKNLAPFCHLFCSREQFFLRDKPTPTHFLQILDLPPPRAVQLGIQRGNPCSHSSWRTAQAVRLGTIQGGGQIIQQVKSSYQPTIGGSTPPHLMTNSRDFQQNVPNKTYPTYHE